MVELPFRFTDREGYFRIVKYLIDTDRLNLCTRGKYGRTPLHYFLFFYLVILEYLIDIKGLNFNFGDVEKNTLLHDAARRGFL